MRSRGPAILLVLLFLATLLVIPNSSQQDFPPDEIEEREDDAPRYMKWRKPDKGMVIRQFLSPTGDLLLIAEDGSIHCIRSNGTMRWKLDLDATSSTTIFFDESGSFITDAGKDLSYISVDGKIIWQKEKEHPFDLYHFHESGIIFAYGMYYGITAFDHKGDELWNWSKEYDLDVDPETNRYYQVDLFPTFLDDGLIFHVWEEDYSEYSDTRLYRLNLQGNVVWNRTIDPHLPYSYDGLLNNGTYIFTTLDLENGNSNLTLMDQNGTILHKMLFVGSYPLFLEQDENDTIFLYENDLEQLIIIDDGWNISKVETNIEGRVDLDRAVLELRLVLITIAIDDERTTFQMKDFDNSSLYEVTMDLEKDFGIYMEEDGTVIFIGSDNHFHRIFLDGTHEIGPGVPDLRFWEKNWYQNRVVWSNEKIFINSVGSMCFDKDLDHLWTYHVEGQPLTGPVVMDDDSIIIPTKDSMLTSFDRDGFEKWSVEINGAMTTPPVVYGSNLIGITSSGVLFSCSLAGEIIWEKELEGKFESEPFIGPDGQIMVISQNNVVSVFSINGDPIWNHERGGTGRSNAVFDDDGNSYVCINNNLFSFDIKGDIRWNNQTGNFDLGIAIDDEGFLYTSAKGLEKFDLDGKWIDSFDGGYDLEKMIIEDDGLIVGTPDHIYNVKVIDPVNQTSQRISLNGPPSKPVKWKEGRYLVMEGYLSCFTVDGHIDWRIGVPYRQRSGYNDNPPAPAILSDGSIVFVSDAVYLVSEQGPNWYIPPPEIKSIGSRHPRLKLDWSYEAPDDIYLLEGFEIRKGTSTKDMMLLYRSNWVEDSFSVTGVEFNKNLTYRIYPLGYDQEKGRSKTIEAYYLPKLIIPTMPSDYWVDHDVGEMILYWSYPEDDGDYPILAYNIYRSLDGDNYTLFRTVGPDETSFTDHEVENGEFYWYKVSAQNFKGESRNTTAWRGTPKRDYGLDYNAGNLGVMCGLPIAVVVIIALVGFIYLSKRNDKGIWTEGRRNA